MQCFMKHCLLVASSFSWVEKTFIDKPDGERRFGHKDEEYFDWYYVIINFKCPIYQWNSYVSAGCYTFPFCFVLPYNNHQYARASIEYKIKSKFILPSGKRLKDKADIYIFEKIQGIFF
ncbi:unnamed protein product [Blepharisma stoltei]|uniref:Uncharacterized protein n=1 Tax=Blepharisma stoltei TaxID=1481888 RepID=A0AAU9K4Y2_9CILI|nr:unnamed protein product [Blepharisma stoltei]